MAQAALGERGGVILPEVLEGRRWDRPYNKEQALLYRLSGDTNPLR